MKWFYLQHYNVELKDNSVDLTEEGVALAEMVLETNDLWDENDPWARFIQIINLNLFMFLVSYALVELKFNLLTPLSC